MENSNQPPLADEKVNEARIDNKLLRLLRILIIINIGLEILSIPLMAVLYALSSSHKVPSYLDNMFVGLYFLTFPILGFIALILFGLTSALRNGQPLGKVERWNLILTLFCFLGYCFWALGMLGS